MVHTIASYLVYDCRFLAQLQKAKSTCPKSWFEFRALLPWWSKTHVIATALIHTMVCQINTHIISLLLLTVIIVTPRLIPIPEIFFPDWQVIDVRSESGDLKAAAFEASIGKSVTPDCLGRIAPSGMKATRSIQVPYQCVRWRYSMHLTLTMRLQLLPQGFLISIACDEVLKVVRIQCLIQ